MDGTGLKWQEEECTKLFFDINIWSKFKPNRKMNMLKKIKENIKKNRPKMSNRKLRIILKLRNIIDDIKAIGSGNNLDRLGKIYGSDKAIGEHFYTPHYKSHLKRFKFRKINLLEIGVGGYEIPYMGGYSLRMWRKYFHLVKFFLLIFMTNPFF